MEMDTRTLEQKISGRSPWKRGRDERWRPCHSLRDSFERFCFVGQNIDLDITTKRAALRVSKYIASLKSCSGEKVLFMGSGIIIECEATGSTFSGVILTSASLIQSSEVENVIADNIKIDVFFAGGKLYEGQVVACDFHYNLAAVKIQSHESLPTATLRVSNDSASIDPHQSFSAPTGSSELRSHSHQFDLYPGEALIVIGRHHEKPYALMAAPGLFRIGRCEFDCKELLLSTSRITKCGIGAPVVNCSGEVIGIAFYEWQCTPFLPSNLVHKWWDFWKRYGRYRRPWLGIEMTNLYAASMHFVELFCFKFPNVFKGVFVKRVLQRSPAASAGLRPDDVIVQCSGKNVGGLLQLLEMMWDKVGEPVEVVVLRTSNGSCQNLSITIDESKTLNRWPLPPVSQYYTRSYR